MVNLTVSSSDVWSCLQLVSPLQARRRPTSPACSAVDTTLCLASRPFSATFAPPLLHHSSKLHSLHRSALAATMSRPDRVLSMGREATVSTPLRSSRPLARDSTARVTTSRFLQLTTVRTPRSRFRFGSRRDKKASPAAPRHVPITRTSICTVTTSAVVAASRAMRTQSQALAQMSTFTWAVTRPCQATATVPVMPAATTTLHSTPRLAVCSASI